MHDPIHDPARSVLADLADTRDEIAAAESDLAPAVALLRLGIIRRSRFDRQEVLERCNAASRHLKTARSQVTEAIGHAQALLDLPPELGDGG